MNTLINTLAAKYPLVELSISSNLLIVNYGGNSFSIPADTSLEVLCFAVERLMAKPVKKKRLQDKIDQSVVVVGPKKTKCRTCDVVNVFIDALDRITGKAADTLQKVMYNQSVGLWFPLQD